MSTPIRVLQVVTIMNRGGAETMIMNYYRKIDKSKVQFDFLVHRVEKGVYEDEIESLGGRIFRIPPLYDVFAHVKGVRQFLKEHKEYKIIHGHVSILGYFLYKEAKKMGFPVIIAHAHNNSCDISWRWPLWMTLRYLIRPHFTLGMTCGREAAIWTFGKRRAKNAIMLNNSIDTTHFAFNQDIRDRVRAQMGWDGHFIIGDVARFSPQKNHQFLLSIFKQVLSMRSDALLVLIGDKTGLYESIVTKAEEMGISDKIQFLGLRTDIPELLQGMDVYCSPSLYEGLSVSMVEAQASGLRIVTSNQVPPEVAIIPELLIFLSITENPVAWSQSILEPYHRYNTIEKITAAGFDVHSSALWLQDFYLNQHHSH